MHERGQAGFTSLNERERHNSVRGLRLLKEHRKAIDEVANRGLNGAPAEIGFGRKMPCFDVQVAAEEGELIGLSFQVGESGICEHEIENGDARLDVFKFMSAAITKIFAAELAIELASEEVIDRAVSRHGCRTRMLVRLEFVPKKGGALAPLDARKGQELPRDEVARMRGNEIQKARLFLRVSESLQCVDMDGCDSHSEKIRAVSSVSSRMRRNFEASSRGA